MKDKILITGARGQLGSDLMAVLGQRYEVVGCDIEDFDITNADAVRQHLTQIKPTIVLHAAAFTDVDRCESEPERAMAVNAEATGYIAATCRDLGARMIYYSTDYVFDGKKRSPYVESDEPNPQTAYGRSKLEGERRVREALTAYAILRLAWVYGAHGKNFVRMMLKLGYEQIRAVQRGEIITPLKVVDDQIGNPTWTMDIARQTEVVLRERLLSGIYHCTSAGETSWYGLTERIFAQLRMTVHMRPCTTDQFPRPAPRPAYSALENAALKAAGQNVMRDWREALAEFLTARKETSLHAM